jgi:hypothetical protein
MIAVVPAETDETRDWFETFSDSAGFAGQAPPGLRQEANTTVAVFHRRPQGRPARDKSRRGRTRRDFALTSRVLRR